jgi:hypothetical protein
LTTGCKWHRFLRPNTPRSIDPVSQAYIVEAICGVHIDYDPDLDEITKSKHMYLCHWKGYLDLADSWKHKDNFFGSHNDYDPTHNIHILTKPHIIINTKDITNTTYNLKSKTHVSFKNQYSFHISTLTQHNVTLT